MASPLSDVIKALEPIVPITLADTTWDNVGTLVDVPEPRKGKNGKRTILTCIDLTAAVCDEAISDPECVVLLTYHPPIFRGLKSISMSTPLQASLLKCITNGIPIYCMHTAADNALYGVNDYLAQAFVNPLLVPDAELQLTNVKAITVDSNAPQGHEGAGTGRMVTLDNALSREKVIESVKSRVGVERLQVAWAINGATDIKTVAICAGSGSSVLRGVKADLYLMGEGDHHFVLEATAKGTHVILTHHSTSERPWLQYFAPKLSQALNKVAPDFTYTVKPATNDFEPIQIV